jgi:hypothetical protein
MKKKKKKKVEALPEPEKKKKMGRFTKMHKGWSIGE